MARTQQRQAAARDKMEEKLEDLRELEQDVVDELAEIDAKWSERAAQIEEVSIGLEKTDIDMDELALVWVPAQWPTKLGEG